MSATPPLTPPEIEVLRLEITKLELKPGDVLVIKRSKGHYMTMEEAEALRALLPPEIRVWSISDDTELSIIRKEELIHEQQSSLSTL